MNEVFMRCRGGMQAKMAQMGLPLFAAVPVGLAVPAAGAVAPQPTLSGRRFMIKGGFLRSGGSGRRMFAVGIILSGPAVGMRRREARSTEAVQA
jgi:hypothetical protein